MESGREDADAVIAVLQEQLLKETLRQKQLQAELKIALANEQHLREELAELRALLRSESPTVAMFERVLFPRKHSEKNRQETPKVPAKRRVKNAVKSAVRRVPGAQQIRQATRQTTAKN